MSEHGDKVGTMDTHQRRVAIWSLLASSPQPFTVLELARRYLVAKNTIKRDLDQLSRGGARIEESEQRSGLASRFRSQNKPPPVDLTPGERAALQAAQLTFSPWAGAPLAVDLTSALSKLGVAMDVTFEAKGPVPAVRVRPEVLRVVMRGMRERLRCRLSYRRRNARDASSMEVEPLRIVCAGGLFYLRAVERPGGGLITLALHLAEEAELQGERFTSTPDRSTGFGAFEGKPEKVVVRFHPDIAPFIEERLWHPSQRLALDVDGYLRFEARLSGMYEFVGWVMSWGPRAELLAPIAWRQEVATRAQRIAKMYDSETAVMASQLAAGRTHES